MNELSVPTFADAALNWREPELPRSLAVELERFIDASAKQVMRAADREAAADLVPFYEQACRPGTRAEIGAWLWGIARAVRNPPPDETSLQHRVDAVCQASGDLPVGVWTSQTQGRALRTMKFWPSAADVDEFVRPIGDRLERRLRNLRKIAGASVFTPVRGVTQEQEQAYREQVGRQQAANDRTAQSTGPEAVFEVDVNELRRKYEAYLDDPDAAVQAMARQVLNDLLSPVKPPLRAPSSAPARTAETAPMDARPAE